jgi:hypothetical protein
MGTSVGRNQGSPNSLFFIDVPAGEQSMSVSFDTADANPDNPYTYELFDPSGAEAVADATPTTTLQGVGSGTPIARANLSVADPAPGRWLIVVVLNLTTSGNNFSQVVNGDVTFNNSGVTVLSGLPTASTTTVAQGASQPVLLQVTNTTGVGRTFTFSSNQSDIAPVSAHIPTGVTELATLTLAPTAAPGTVVSGQLVSRPTPPQTIAASADVSGPPIHLHGRAAGHLVTARSSGARRGVGELPELVPVASRPGRVLTVSRPRSMRTC